jgi:hypothetical protein
MSKQAADHHKKATELHAHAARHHREAAKRHETEVHEKAAHHAHLIVACLHCRRVVTLATGIGEAALPRLQAHLFVCQPQEAIGTAVNVEEVRRHFRVISVDLDDEPPPAA